LIRQELTPFTTDILEVNSIELHLRQIISGN
jgi:hypothetical protein